MSVLVFADQHQGKLKKSTFEAAAYAAKTAKLLNTEAIAIVLGKIAEDELSLLGAYGIKKVLHAANELLETMDATIFTKIIAEAAEKESADVIIFSHNFHGKAIAPRLAVRLKSGLVSGAVELPETANGFLVKRNVFSGKAFGYINIKSKKKIITLNPNSFKAEKIAGTATVEAFSAEVQAADFKIKVIKEETLKDEVPLTEAEIIVSGGRGLKGPENWGMIENLAKALDAGLACSRPVADSGWRPHHEHVGQTGLTVRPDLYLAIGISGAIQHLAGVNGSKVMAVINKDPEAPFFKAADYGMVGDAFEIVPKLTEAINQYKATVG